MPLFASGRERRLWLWTLAVVVGIYATIGFGSTVAGVLREGGLIEASLFLGAMCLVGAHLSWHRGCARARVASRSPSRWAWRSSTCWC